MQVGLLHLHNIMRWVVIIFMIITLVRSFKGNRPFTSGDKKSALFLMISMDIQLLIGMYLYLVGAWGLKNIETQGMATLMKDTIGRFWAVEHITGMVISVILVHFGYAATKKDSSDASKFKKLFWYTLIAAIIIFVTIPWPFRAGIARPLFPGM